MSRIWRQERHPDIVLFTQLANFKGKMTCEIVLYDNFQFVGASLINVLLNHSTNILESNQPDFDTLYFVSAGPPFTKASCTRWLLYRAPSFRPRHFRPIHFVQSYLVRLGLDKKYLNENTLDENELDEK